MAAAKTARIPIVKRTTITIMAPAARFLCLLHSQAVTQMAATDRRISPKYTVYPRSMYILPKQNTPPRKYLANRGRDVTFAQNTAR